jgi:prophage antirepressor-like protein
MHTPMMENEEGELFCTSLGLCSALGIPLDALDKLAMRHKDELSPLRLTDRTSKEFFQEHRVEFGITRVRSDLRLWSELDMLAVATYSRSPVAKEFRREMWQFVKKNATKNYVTREEYNQLLSRVEPFLAAQPALQVAASAAGLALNAQKGTVHLRRVK